MEVPRITKITLNMGLGEASPTRRSSKRRWRPDEIAGQKPVIRRHARHRWLQDSSGLPIGAMLRCAPGHVRISRSFRDGCAPPGSDFRGVSGRAFDGPGNYNIGVKEQIIFPEIDYDKIDALRGLNISITTTRED